MQLDRLDGADRALLELVLERARSDTQAPIHWVIARAPCIRYTTPWRDGA